jgi:hypothetical protein
MLEQTSQLSHARLIDVIDVYVTPRHRPVMRQPLESR